ncbi:hypothetical protein AXY43_05470 [Clostridium sp. MF28]|uniref:hypothetical protein n=1 Tax=Clostridium TaxID=1485 RepID=UPI000CF95C46|nr:MULTISPECIES: hypothetical protein [Clostridium]AVK47515.1 hypothetical protein AXY43_05470 [Clostridium sp. MF28]PSM58687.1 hypothetical protein C4L39_05855 [Clostridium diolis]
MSLIVIAGSLILGTSVFGIINKKLKFLSLSTKKVAMVWGICFLAAMIVTSIAVSLIHGVVSLILLAIKIAPIVLAIYGVYYVRKKLNNKGANIE